MAATLAPHAKLHSPVAFKPFDGREQISTLFEILLDVFEDFRYTDELASPDGETAALIFRTRIASKEVEGLDLIRPGADGLIEDFTVMVRPLSAAIALAEAVGPRLAAAGVSK
jgi:hypothetical protein